MRSLAFTVLESHLNKDKYTLVINQAEENADFESQSIRGESFVGFL